MLFRSPMVSHIDQPRREYNRDGTITVRSTREWVSSLTHHDEDSNDPPLVCDIVNGSADRKTSLLVPKYYLAEATKQLRDYKLRLSPPSHREARYKDSVSGLPSVIQISTSLQSNLSFMDTYSARIWNKAPASVRGNPSNRESSTTNQNSARGNKKSHLQFPNFSDPHFSSDKSNMHNQTQHATDTNSRRHDTRPLPFSTNPLSPPIEASVANDTNDAGGGSNASTPLTRGSSMTTTQSKFRDLDAMIKRQQKMIDLHAKQTAERLSTIEQHFQRFDALNSKIDQVSDQVIQAASENQPMAQAVRADKARHNRTMQSQNLAYQDHCDKQIGRAHV